MQYKIDDFLFEFRDKKHARPENELIFFSRLKGESYDKLFSKFYITAKVHKRPWKTRPVVPTCGTFWHGLSRWADVYLQELKQFCPSYLRDSYQLLEELSNIGTLPEGTMMFTMDAVSMYTNIDTNHGLKILEQFIGKFRDDLPIFWPAELLLMAMNLIMRDNCFEFGPSMLE